MTVEQSDLLNIYKTRVAYLEGQLKANFEVVNSLMSAQVRKSFSDVGPQPAEQDEKTYINGMPMQYKKGDK